MTPDAIAKYRTQDSKHWNWVLRVCRVCKKSRSLRQFVGESTVCLTCKGK